MKNLLINYLSGDKFLESFDLEIYFKSLKKIDNVDKIAVVSNLSPQNIDLIKQKYDHVVQNDAPFYYIYYAYYDILSQIGKDYKYAMYMDTRDVVIQKNPFEYMESRPEKDLFLVCEGMKVCENDCNLFWHNALSSTQIFPNRDGHNNLVTNGGTIGGKTKDLTYMMLLAISNFNRKANTSITDQCVLTSLYPYLKNSEHIDYCHPYTSNFCVTGEAVKYKNIDMKFIDGQACNMQGEPYYLFHQWDRTQYAEIIRNKEKSTLSFSI